MDSPVGSGRASVSELVVLDELMPEPRARIVNVGIYPKNDSAEEGAI